MLQHDIKGCIIIKLAKISKNARELLIKRKKENNTRPMNILIKSKMSDLSVFIWICGIHCDKNRTGRIQ